MNVREAKGSAQVWPADGPGSADEPHREAEWRSRKHRGRHPRAPPPWRVHRFRNHRGGVTYCGAALPPVELRAPAGQ
jgi:hypothetical protein